MTDDLKIWLPPMLTLLGTLIVVVFTAWLNSRAVLAHIEGLRQEMRAGVAEVRLEIASLRTELKLEIVELRNRVDRMEGERRVIR